MSRFSPMVKKSAVFAVFKTLEDVNQTLVEYSKDKTACVNRIHTNHPATLMSKHYRAKPQDNPGHSGGQENSLIDIVFCFWVKAERKVYLCARLFIITACVIKVFGKFKLSLSAQNLSI
jgi:hypothetical protein